MDGESKFSYKLSCEKNVGTYVIKSLMLNYFSQDDLDGPVWILASKIRYEYYSWT